ncbi:MAG: hypothetical protein GC181_13435 [Bacteroidetes bacterium]|nr:hypothetical protein [Bacteroidota bacterium]
MIRVFQSIKQSLINEKKFSNYLLYALREIVLVVIGILIALQINNWNDERKNRVAEHIQLKNIETELKVQLLELEVDLRDHTSYQQSTLDILKYIASKPELHDSMYVDFYNSVSFNYTFPKKSSYEALKNGNLNIIKSDKLLSLITEIYESGYDRITQKVNTRRNAARVLFPYYQANFRSKNNLNICDTSTVKSITAYVPKLGQNTKIMLFGIPNDYDKLMNDPEYETLVNEALIGRTMMIQDLKSTIALINNCLKEIDAYIKNNPL